MFINVWQKGNPQTIICHLCIFRHIVVLTCFTYSKTKWFEFYVPYNAVSITKGKPLCGTIKESMRRIKSHFIVEHYSKYIVPNHGIR